MNIIQEIKAFFVAKRVFEEIKTEATKMDTKSGKPGWKTTEWWLSLATQAGVLWGAIQGFIPPKYAAIIAVAGTAVYTVARTIAKAVSDIQAAKATQATVTTTQPVTTITTPA